MRYRLLFLFGILPFLMIGQNPLKKELKGNGTSMFYSPSQFSFTNQSGATVYITELKDNRSIHWNKQVNDSVRIESIGDFWNFPMVVLFKNKINQDLSKANVNVDYSAQGENIYKIEPTIDVLYPNFVLYPNKGYWILAKINMQVSKGSQKLFTKSYQEYTFFNKNINGYKESFNTDLKEGANVAMWSSMKRLLDQFYGDLNGVMGGKSIQSSDIALNTIGASNIANDANLNNQVDNYSGTKSTKESNPPNNYKLDGDVPPLPPPTDSKLDNAVNSMGKPTTINTTIKQPTSIPVLDSAKLAERKAREELRKKALDSAKRAKEELVLATKKVEQDEKEKIQFKRDSILKVKKDALALKIREKTQADSAKKAEISQKIEAAKKKREEEKAKLNPKSDSESTSDKSASVPKNVEPAVEKKKPQSIAKKTFRRSGNETISEALRRIAKEIEEEENGAPRVAHAPIEKNSTVNNETEPNNSKVDLIAKRNAERAKIMAEMKNKKGERDSLLALDKQKKQDSLLAIRKAKAMEIEQAMARAKASKDSVAKIIAAKKYVEDSVLLVREKERRREAVLAAQKAAMEAERNYLSKNPNAGEMFATVSTDPPSKLPDARTREQVLADRIFTPKSESTKNLLARVKLITPEEEARMLSQMKTDDKAIVDSFFIQMQKNRPVPTYTPLDTLKTSAPSKSDIAPKTVSKDDKKAQIIEKGLKSAKDAKDLKVTQDKKDAKSKVDSTARTVLDKGVKATTNLKDKPAASTAKGTAPKETDKVEAPKMDSTTIEKKAQDLEAEIEKKKKEINDRLKKAKAW
jgi:hypothetical protein